MSLQNDITHLTADVDGKLNIEYLDVGDPRVIEELGSCIKPSDDTVHVYSDEWSSRSTQCAGFIRARAGMFERRVGARLCSVTEVPREAARAFLEATHIQGSNNLGVVYFGIYDGGLLIGMMSLGRHSRGTSKNRIVLDRLCFSHGIQVIGGASRLMKAARSWAKSNSYDEIITFSDNRWTNGSLYRSIGFKMDRALRPDYSYVAVDGTRLTKQSQKKKSTGCPDGMTEHEWASHRGLRRIYDAGKKRWVMNLWPGVHETRNERSSKRCAKQHESGAFRHAHIRGHFMSRKSERSVYYGSSYELRCMFLLEGDTGVSSFRRCSAFKGADGWRNPDLWVEFSDGKEEVWEVKPSRMMLTAAAKEQVRESIEFAKSKGVEFRLWTEADSGLGGDHEIIRWAREFLDSVGNPSQMERHKEIRKNIRKRSYERAKKDTVDVWCDFCGDTHTRLRLTYDRNIKKNGVFVCAKENGSIVGRRTKRHLKKINPYASDGKKKCSTCRKVKPIDGGFHVRRASWDGVAPRCTECSKRKRSA